VNKKAAEINQVIEKDPQSEKLKDKASFDICEINPKLCEDGDLKQ
tara:strand:+ start:326 stop:460 length:135 start_codon:yes stop_codon:yes gene_type:complete